MTLALLCSSHSPLMDFNDPGDLVKSEVDGVFARAREFVADFDPTLVVSFGPDHYNGFFYDLMPPFAVCYAGVGVGDYGTQEGPFDVPEDIAHGMTEHAQQAGIDMTISRAAQLDHGAVQIPQLVLGGIDRCPTVPVFVNGVSAPFVPMQRIRLMGAALGEYLSGLDERVLLIGSGGLSHDPPVPRWATATDQQKEFLLSGRNPTPEARAARQERVISGGKAFAAGEAPHIRELNPAWDEEFMDACASGDSQRFDAYTAEQMVLDAGNSAHEVRCWVAACSAMAAAGPYRVTDRYYRAIPEWIAGFGYLAALSA